MKIIELDGKQVNMNDSICSAIGFFDGLHIGHMALVEEVKKVAKKKNYKTALMTFDHYPLYVLGKIKEEKMLTTMDDRIKLLEREGLDYLFIIKFTKDVAALRPQDFIQNYIINNHIQHLVCGFDFRFGNKNSGNIELLKSYQEFDLSVIDEVIYEEKKISSTRIRQSLEIGDVETISILLGRNYCIHGEVIKGRSVGHTLGFPTANINYHSYFLPKRGVYGVRVQVNDQWYIGMCNIGLNPTFKSLESFSLEVYIFDFDEMIYGKEVYIEFYCHLRDEKKFQNKEELIIQLTNDEKQIRQYFQKMFL